MADPWRSRKKCSPARRRFLVEPRQAAANRFSRNTKHETRPLLWRGMGRLWRGMGGDCPPHRQHGFMHFTKHETRDTNHGFYAFLPTIARHCPRLPAKKKSQALVVSQYGRGSRGPGRVPRAAPRQPSCTVEQTNHEPRSFLARGASRREIQGFHESRNTAFPRAPRESARNPRFSRKTKNKKLKTGFEVFTRHETRNTNHGFFSIHGLLSCASAVGW